MGPEPLEPPREVRWPTPNDPGDACRVCGRDVSHGDYVNVALAGGGIARECNDCRADGDDGPDEAPWRSGGDDAGYRGAMLDAGRGGLLR
jgi:hypothetical protein